MNIDDPVSGVPGARRAVVAALAKPPFELGTVHDLLWYLPRADGYRDLGAHTEIADLVVGETATVVGTLSYWEKVTPRRQRGRRLILHKAHISVSDGGQIVAPFFNQQWLPAKYQNGDQIAVTGTVDQFRSEIQLKNAKIADVETVGDGAVGASREGSTIQTVYRATEKLPTTTIAALIDSALAQIDHIDEYLPASIIDAQQLLSIDAALRAIHQPMVLDDVGPARKRLVYDELFGLQVTLQQRRVLVERNALGLDHSPVPGGGADLLNEVLPFAPTIDQLAAFAEIDQDLATDRPMHRLLQGDVGTGKTLVAVHTMLRVIDHGRQAVLMAPTQVLAEQHHATINEMLADVIIPDRGRPPRVRVLTSNLSAAERRSVLRDVAAGECDVLIGTHAVLEDNVVFYDLGCVIIDEQHRFGVGHRAALAEKRPDGRVPDVLVMTATPIPRSLALTRYGDLDVTTLKNRPGQGQIDVKTTVLETDSPRREKLYGFIRDELTAGRRAFVVCPLIEASEHERFAGIANAVDVHRDLSTGPFRDFTVGLLHGRMSAEERNEVMAAFRDGDVQLLVATTVIEVGVSVDDASVMVIENADRFGIAQLHQLRGRLWRGYPTNYCVLFTDNVENARLDALVRHDDGFVLAETDMMLRREGTVFDTAQTGETDLAIASLIDDADVVVQTASDVARLLADDPELANFPELVAELRRRVNDEDLSALRGG